MQVLVTGANGFIGNRLATYLAHQGHDVIPSGRRSLPESSKSFREGDLTQLTDCQKISQGCDAIIHCAGKAGAWGSYQSFYEANVTVTRNLLEACRRNGVSKFINLSSPSIYFSYKDQWNLKEDQIPKKFSNAYAETKYEAEGLVADSHSENLWTLSLRPRGVIGAGDKSWLPRIIAMRKANRLIQVGNGKNIADFTSVTNLVEAIHLALQSDKEAYGRVYNITNGEPLPIWEVISNALKAVGLSDSRKKVPLSLLLPIARLSEGFFRLTGAKNEPTLLPIKIGVAAYSMTLDISLAREHLKYQPRATTQDAIEEFAQWWVP